jgi:hypothetical protein
MRFALAAAVFLLGSAPDATGAPSGGTITTGEWSPSIIIHVVALGPIDLSSIITPQRYEKKIDCERDVRAAVATMLRLYPTLVVKVSACIRVPG